MDGSDPYFVYYQYNNHDDLVNVYPPFVTYPKMHEPEGPFDTQSIIPTAMTSCTAAFTRNFRSVTPSITFTIMATTRCFRRMASNVFVENGLSPLAMN